MANSVKVYCDFDDDNKIGYRGTFLLYHQIIQVDDKLTFDPQ